MDNGASCPVWNNGFRSLAVERNGRIYEKLNIHKWQAKVPDMSRVFPKPKYCPADL